MVANSRGAHGGDATDLKVRRIPNWLVVPFLLAGLAGSVVTGGWAGLGNSMLGLILGGFTTGVFYILGGMGMGDVKLCAAIGAWVGPEQMGLALVAIGLAGGVLAILWAAGTGRLSGIPGLNRRPARGFRQAGLRPTPN